MQTESYELDFDGRELKQLIHRPTGRIWVNGGGNLCSWGLVRGEDLEWSDSGPAHTDLSVREDKGLLSWTLKLTNHSDTFIGSVIFPKLTGLTLDYVDSFTWPFAAGGFVHFENLHDGDTLELTYPVYASMQWMDAFSSRDEMGFYFAAHDPHPHFKYLIAGKENGSRRFAIEWHGVMIKPGETFEFPPVVMAVHDRFWYGGADIYREWIRPHLQQRRIPEWFAKDPTSYCAAMKEQGRPKPDHQFNELPAMARAIRKSDGKVLHCIGYHEDGFDTNYPRYYAGESMGGDAALKEGAEGLRSEGVELSFYTNGRIMDSTWPDKEEIHRLSVKRPRWSTERMARMWDNMVAPNHNSWDPRGSYEPRAVDWNRDGQGVTEWWGRIFAACCPGTTRWRELLTERITGLARDFGAMVFQMDQVCGCWGMACFDETHEHERPSLAWAAYRPFIRELRRQLDEINPDICLWTEGMNDLLGESYDCLQFAQGFNTLFKGVGYWDPEVFHYTLPEFIAKSGNLAPDDVDALNLTFVRKGYFFYDATPDPDWSARCSPLVRSYHKFLMDVRHEYWDVITYGIIIAPDRAWPSRLIVFIYEYGSRVVLLAVPRFGSKADPDKTVQYDVPLPKRFQNWIIKEQKAFQAIDAPAVLKEGRILWTGDGPLVLELAKG